VLRCGLTPKHVDVAEVLRVADFSELLEPRCPATQVNAQTRVFQTPVADFQLAVTALDGAGPVKLDHCASQILLCTDGIISATLGDEKLQLRRGAAAYLRAGAIAELAGAGTLFRATTDC
jgi:mannose-6-phosphate isomerase